VSLRFQHAEIPGVVVVEPNVHRDARGFFLETYHAEKYHEGGITEAFVQDNHSYSGRSTLRGLHVQIPHSQGKLVRVIEGEIFDVAVDIRRGSPTYARHVGVTLSSENFKQLYVPPGIAHGFVVASEFAQVEYKCTDLYHPDCELTIAWDDPDLSIPWPVENPVLSAKDAKGARLRDIEDRLVDYK
jgi:dTDP-4-dehydrorhamnose 3,5-epimerase